MGILDSLGALFQKIPDELKNVIQQNPNLISQTIQGIQGQSGSPLNQGLRGLGQAIGRAHTRGRANQQIGQMSRDNGPVQTNDQPLTGVLNPPTPLTPTPSDMNPPPTTSGNNLDQLLQMDGSARQLGIPVMGRGGPVSGGQPVVVGDQGPELFVPHDSGQVVPNDQMDPDNDGDNDMSAEGDTDHDYAGAVQPNHPMGNPGSHGQPPSRGPIPSQGPGKGSFHRAGHMGHSVSSGLKASGHSHSANHPTAPSGHSKFPHGATHGGSNECPPNCPGGLPGHPSKMSHYR